ncbi:MAG: hypothetical protein IPH13_18010 [Planctomycetes bacterium]|nr:hypothetical protein [Planctomycetota bacterium]MCC7170444.1 hypothetical protein [Planctomycetota bacterium]
MIAEIALQVVSELLFELGLRGVGEAVAPRKPWLAAIGYALLGAIAGGISLQFFPAHLLQNPAARIANLLLTPLAAGAAMTGLGRWRRRKGQRIIQLDTFAYGCLFALAMAIVRLALCE